ncbi:MAG: hypothetical protein V1738_04180 [Patescibacteria group bacterium]
METGKRIKIALLAGAVAVLVETIVCGAYVLFVGSLPTTNLQLFSGETTLQWELSRWLDVPIAFIWGFALMLMGTCSQLWTDTKSKSTGHLLLASTIGLFMAAGAANHGLVDGTIMAGGYLYVIKITRLERVPALTAALISGLSVGLVHGLAMTLSVLLIVAVEMTQIIKSAPLLPAAQEKSQHSTESV